MIRNFELRNIFIQFLIYCYPRISTGIKIAYDDAINDSLIIESFPKQLSGFHCIPESKTTLLNYPEENEAIKAAYRIDQDVISVQEEPHDKVNREDEYSTCA